MAKVKRRQKKRIVDERTRRFIDAGEDALRFITIRKPKKEEKESKKETKIGKRGGEDEEL